MKLFFSFEFACQMQDKRRGKQISWLSWHLSPPICHHCSHDISLHFTIDYLCHITNFFVYYLLTISPFIHSFIISAFQILCVWLLLILNPISTFLSTSIILEKKSFFHWGAHSSATLMPLPIVCSSLLFNLEAFSTLSSASASPLVATTEENAFVKLGYGRSRKRTMMRYT